MTTAAIAKKISSPFATHWDRHYVTAKMKTDPLYAAVYEELHHSGLPLLDLGCGLGLLAFYLRERGLPVAIHGLDYDARKIRAAEKAAGKLGFEALSFATHDARQGLPEHSGNVTILDILQFFTPGEQEALLQLAAARLAPGGRLVIRSGLRDASGRFRITVACDWLARFSFWMKAAPTHYPSAEDFQRVLAPYGCVRISPLWGGTPFNNHLIVLES